MRFLIFCLVALFLPSILLAGGGEHNFVNHPLGYISLIIFVIAYFFIATEENYQLNKAKPALFAGTLLFIIIGIELVFTGQDLTDFHHEVELIILEIANIFFFLYVAMTYIETLIERNVFEVLRYSLVSKGYSYKKIFWLTGIMSFFISPIADNLTTALIMSTVLITISKDNLKFLVPGAINVVVAANAGGAWSPFGDLTTLMAWTAGKGTFVDFLFLFPASLIGYLATAYLLSRLVPNNSPEVGNEKEVKMKDGAKVIMALGLGTIAMAVIGHQLLHIPAMWGMMFGLSVLSLYAYFLKRSKKKDEFDVFHSLSKVENDTLLFFFGILAAVGALHFLGYLALVSKGYEVAGVMTSSIIVGVVSAIVDNVPVMSAVIKADPAMGKDGWMLVTLTIGIGGSLISFGSAAGVGVMGKLKGIYTFSAHFRYIWMVFIGYIVSIAVWYVQYEILGLYPH